MWTSCLKHPSCFVCARACEFVFVRAGPCRAYKRLPICLKSCQSQVHNLSCSGAQIQKNIPGAPCCWLRFMKWSIAKTRASVSGLQHRSSLRTLSLSLSLSLSIRHMEERNPLQTLLFARHAFHLCAWRHVLLLRCVCCVCMLSVRVFCHVASA